MDTYLACDDCVMAIEYGDTPADRPELASDIDRLWAGYDLFVSGSGEGEFSWSACECCGSRLGGHRSDFVARKCADV
jgi:hypothetical protein